MRRSSIRTERIGRFAFAASGVAVVVLGLSAVPAFANDISILNQQMEGSLTLHAGDYIAAGWEFTIPGNHPDTTAGLVDAYVTIPVSCTSGSSTIAGTITINLPYSGPSSTSSTTNSNGPTTYNYDDPLNGSDWYPTVSANESDPVTFQGSTVAPDLCSGGAMYSDSQTGGANLYGDLQATSTADQIHVQFHYRDPNAKGDGNIDCSNGSAAQNPSPGNSSACGASWSSTTSFTPDATPGGDPLPVGAIGGLGFAAIAGVALVVTTLRRRRRPNVLA